MSSTFDDLTQALTNEEKKNLLGRIQTSLNLSAKDTDNIISKSEAPEDLKQRLSKEVAELGFFDRLIVQFLAFFRNRSEAEILGDRKLLDAKTVLRERAPNLVSFSKQEWTPEFAKVLYDLFAEAASLRPVFDHLFQQKLTLETGLLKIIEEEHPRAVHVLEELFPEAEIAQVYQADPRRAAVIAELDRRLAAYLKAIPDDVFARVEARLRPLYNLRPLVQYPYGFLLELFGHNAERTEISKYPYFLGAPWLKTAGLLERLYYGLHMASKIEVSDIRLDRLFGSVADKIADENNAWTTEKVVKRVNMFLEQAHDAFTSVPWKEVLQWSFQDPYYSVRFVVPRFSLGDFYETILTMNLKDELDRTIPEVRRELLINERTLLFKNASFDPLDFYVSGVGATLGTQKVSGFAYPESLGAVWAFLSHHFTKRIQPFHQSLVRLAAPGSKGVLQGLTNVVDELNQLKLKVRQFDRTLHPDSEEGKTFHKLKLELNSKALSLKPFVQIVQEKDAVALELANRGLEGLNILLQQLSGVRDRNIPTLKSVLKLPYLLEGQQETVENGLDRLLVIVQKTIFVLKETLSLES